MFKIFSKIKEGIKKTKDNVIEKINNVFKKFSKIDEKFFSELEEILICADVGVETTEEICENLKDLVRKKNYRNKYTFNSPLNFRKSEK